jgi:hypothetical protein
MKDRRSVAVAKLVSGTWGIQRRQQCQTQPFGKTSRAAT